MSDIDRKEIHMKTKGMIWRVLMLLLCLFLIGCQGDNGSAATTDSGTDEIYGSFGVNDGTQDSDPGVSDTEADTSKDTETVLDTVETEDIGQTETSDTATDTEEIIFDTESDTEAETEADPKPSGDQVVVGGREVIDLSDLLAAETSVAGRFISYQNDHLRLVVDYDCYMAHNGNVTVELAVGLECYELYCGPRNQMGRIIVDGVSHAFSTDVIDHRQQTLLYVPFATHTYQSGGRDSCMIDVTWSFNGTYGEAEIGTLAASALLTWDTSVAPDFKGDDTTPADTTEETPDTTAPADTEEHTTPITEPVTEAVTEPVTEAVTEAVTEPDTTEIVIETDAQTTETVTESVSDVQTQSDEI